MAVLMRRDHPAHYVSGRLTVASAWLAQRLSTCYTAQDETLRVPFPSSAASTSSSQTSIAVSAADAIGTAVRQPCADRALHISQSGGYQVHVVPLGA